MTTAELVRILPPSAEAFDGATRLVCGPEVEKLLDAVLKYPEFKDLAAVPGAILWFQRRKLIDGEPVFTVGQPWSSGSAGDAVWYADRVRKVEDFPRWVVGLYWRNFDDLSSEGNYVTSETLERHIYLALMSLEVTEGGKIVRRQPSVRTWHEAIERYGAYDTEMIRLQGLLAIPED